MELKLEELQAKILNLIRVNGLSHLKWSNCVVLFHKSTHNIPNKRFLYIKLSVIKIDNINKFEVQFSITMNVT